MAGAVRYRIHVAAEIDENGDAEIVRTWTVENIGDLEVSLPGQFDVEISPCNVQVIRVSDGKGVLLPWFTDEVAPNGTRIVCPFDVDLPPGTRFHLHLRYLHSRYFTQLRGQRGWMLTETFSEASPTFGVTVEQPFELSYELTFHDPRSRWPLIHNPFQDWLLGSPEQFTPSRTATTRGLAYLVPLRGNQKSPELQILSLVSSRAAWASVVVTGAWTIVGAVLGFILSR